MRGDVIKGTVHPQRCPVCGQAPISTVERRNGSLTSLNYLCPNEHAWLVKFLAVKA